MKSYQNTAIFVLAILLILSQIRSCQDRADIRRLTETMRDYQMKEKVFEVRRLKDSSTIADQGQTILTEKQAMQSGLVRIYDDLKKLQAQVTHKSEVRIIEKQVPFIPDGFADTTGAYRDTAGVIVRRDSIAVPVRARLEERWFQIDALVTKTGLKIDSLKIPNKLTMTIAYKKTGFLKLRKEAIVRVQSDNPYVQTTGMDNIVVKKKKRPWALITAAIGFGLGFFIK